MSQDLKNHFNLLALPIGQKRRDDAPDEARAIMGMLHGYGLTSFYNQTPLDGAKRWIEKILNSPISTATMVVTKAHSEPPLRLSTRYLMGMFFKPGWVDQAGLTPTATLPLSDIFSRIQRQSRNLDQGLLAVTTPSSDRAGIPIAGYFATGHTLNDMSPDVLKLIIQRRPAGPSAG